MVGKWALILVVALSLSVPLHAQFALEFNGVTDYVRVEDNDVLDGMGAITVEAWINMPVRRIGYILGKWGILSESASYVFGFSGSSKLIFRYVPEGLNYVQFGVDWGAVPLNQWVHVAAVYDGSEIRIFINGNLVGSSGGFGGAINASRYPLTVGKDQIELVYGLTGTIDEVRISDISRYSGNFVPADYFSTDSSTVGLWHFNEGGGDLARDETTYGNDGQLGSTPGPDSSDPEWVLHGGPLLPVDLFLLPSGPTMIPIGGILGFSTLILNSRASIVEGDYWVSLVTPDSTEVEIPEALLNFSNPVSGQVFPGGAVELSNELWIHPRADTGFYSLIGRIGEYPSTIIDEESFGFRVVE